MSQSFISTLLCVLGILSFTRPITAQTAAPVDSAVIKGSADTPDHPLLHQPKATSTGRKIMRAPANTVGLIFKGLIHTVGKPVFHVFTSEGAEKDKNSGSTLSRTHLFIGDGSQGIGSGWGVAVGIEAQLGRTTPLTVRLSSAITFRTYQTHLLQLTQTITPRTSVEVWGQYRYRPRDIFFGIGSSSLKTAKSNYKQTNYNTGVGLGYQGGGFAVRGLIDWTDYKVDHGTDSLSPSTLITFPGLIGGGVIRLVSTGVDFLAPLLLYRKPGWDTGIEMSFRAYFDVEGSTYGFNTYQLTLYQAVPIFWEDRVLAVRATGLIADARSGKAVPFFLLPRLGGSGTLRGFDDLRFHDTKAFVINAEYRYPFWNIGINNGVNEGLAGDIVLFMDTGMVFHSFSNDVKYNNLSTNYGFGIRLRRKNGVMGRGMIAHSKETTRFVVSIGRDF
jgi:hypothetical protein